MSLAPLAVRRLKASLWDWPNGLLWRATAPLVARTRARRYEAFLKLVGPRPGETILDVGVTNSPVRSNNYLENAYPHPANITAVGVEDLGDFRRAFPEIGTRLADGRELPFADESFDIVFSNAVLEHVGTRSEQQRFLSESWRVARRAVFVATPSPSFPVDSHTLLPFVHWLPRELRFRMYRATARGYWASVSTLNLVAGDELIALARAAGIRDAALLRQRFAGVATNLMLVARKPT